MTVKRIVLDIATQNVEQVAAFYQKIFDLRPAMDMGWIVTMANDASAPVQISIASEGGAGAAVPDMSIEVDDVDAIFQRAKTLGADILYEVTDEPWGVRRFFLRDPTGKVINVLAHL